MAETLLPLKLPPGFANNGTTYQTKGRWHDGNLVRFFQGNIQPVGGWAQRTLTGDTILGIPRGSHTWQLASGKTAIAVGTTHGLYVIVDDVVYDIVGPGDAMTNVPSRTWTLDNFGFFLVANEVEEGAVQPGNGGVGPWVWDGDLTHFIAVPGPGGAGGESPGATLAVCVTPEQFMVLLGGSNLNLVPAGGPQPRTVFWASQSTTDIWLPAVTNTAGDFDLTTQGILKCGKRTRGQTLLWTSTDLHAMTFIGGVLVYSFAQLGENCGIISSRAAVTQDTQAIWMGVDRFFAYDGFVKPISCELQDYVFNNINRDLVRNIWALSNPAFSEVTWFYPSANASENDRYVTYNYLENHWTYGTLARTAGSTRQEPGVVPIMFDASTNLYDHETGTTHAGADPIFIESGPVEIGNGDNVYSINRLVPDENNLGDLTMTLYGRYRPLGTEVTYGPFVMANEAANVRVKARQIRVRFTQAIADAWRLGTMRLGVVGGSRR